MLESDPSTSLRTGSERRSEWLYGWAGRRFSLPFLLAQPVARKAINSFVMVRFSIVGRLFRQCDDEALLG